MDKCEICGKEFIQDEVSVNGLCMECHKDNEALYCENCGKEIDGEDGIPVSNEMWCDGCVEHKASVCDGCHEHFKSEDVSSCLGSLVETGDYRTDQDLCQEGDWYCENCLDEDGYCSKCCELVPQDIKDEMAGR